MGIFFKKEIFKRIYFEERKWGSPKTRVPMIGHSILHRIRNNK